MYREYNTIEHTQNVLLCRYYEILVQIILTEGEKMALTLMYITNNPEVAEIAQRAGVDRVWVDMEYIDKDLRQGGMDTVQSHHTIEDIKKLRPVVTTAELQVRINHMYDGSEEEINQTVEAGADVIMLPYFKTRKEVEDFIRFVDGRAKTIILVETAEAYENIDDILEVPGIDEVHIGLNDLHLAYGKDFMFELLIDGTVPTLCEKLRKKGIKFGFGGIARVGYGTLPAEHIITEPAETHIPIYEGKFIEQYDNRFSTFAGMNADERYQAKASARRQLGDGFMEPKPVPECRYFIEKNFWGSFLERYDQPYSLCWRSLTSPTNQRTMIASIMPTMPTCQSVQLLQTTRFDDLLLILALFNSKVFDYFVELCTKVRGY